MALIKRYFPGNEVEAGIPTLWIQPGLWNSSRLNVSECIAFADANWDKSVPQTIVFGLYLTDGLDDIMAGGQGLPTIDSAEYQLRNGLPGYRTYQYDWINLLEGLASAGYVIDLIAMDVEATNLYPTITLNTGLGSEFTILEVAQQMYAGDTTNLPKLDIVSLAMDQWTTRLGYQAYHIWNAWIRRMTVAQFKTVFSDTAKQIFTPSCQVCNYDWSKHNNSPYVHWTIQGDVSGRLERQNYIIDEVSAPVLYLNRTFFDTVDEALGALYTVDLPAIPWIMSKEHITRPPGWVLGDEDHTFNSIVKHDQLLAGIEAYGCERVMIW